MQLNILTSNDFVKEYFIQTQATRDPMDAGLDLPIPQTIIVPANAWGFPINHEIHSEMIPLGLWGPWFTYTLEPRSSISDTPLRMSNGRGIIDSGYRGEIIAKVDNHSDQPYKILAGKRLFQILAPTLLPITFKLVDKLSESQRGNKGFGSTS